MAGFTGREIAARLEKFGVASDFIEVEEGLSRINVKVKSNEESEINGQGPKITDANIEALYEQLDKLVEGDILIISGSVPNTLPGDMYERIMSRLEGKGIDIVVDAERALLVNVLKYHPFLIKPNNHELGDIYGVTLKTQDEVIPYAKKLQEEGARNVLRCRRFHGRRLCDRYDRIRRLQDRVQNGSLHRLGKRILTGSRYET